MRWGAWSRLATLSGLSLSGGVRARRCRRQRAARPAPSGCLGARRPTSSCCWEQRVLAAGREPEPAHEAAFYSGNSFFNQAWVEAPASTTARDGLGPLFNARSCSGCHFRGWARAAVRRMRRSRFVGLLLRLSVAGQGAHGAPYAGPGLWGAAPGRGAARRAGRRGDPGRVGGGAGVVEDGAAYTLRAPDRWSPGSRAYGAPSARGCSVSPRVAPVMIGLGLLEAHPGWRGWRRWRTRRTRRRRDLGARHPRGDVLADGRRGRALRLEGRAAHGDAADRRGVPGGHGPHDPLVPAARAARRAQRECLSAPQGGEPEVWTGAAGEGDGLLTAALAVPARRAAGTTRRCCKGQRLFARAGLRGLPRPVAPRRGKAALPELSDQLIWPYTDLLLHDHGRGPGDDAPDLWQASGRGVADAAAVGRRAGGGGGWAHAAPARRARALGSRRRSCGTVVKPRARGTRSGRCGAKSARR
jgi:hypothetical protein